MRSRIIATGSYVPSKVVTNDDLSKIMETNDEWIIQRTGIKERRFEEVSNHSMALKAASNALENLDAQSIDLIIVCTYTPDNFVPTNANLLKKDVGIKADIPCFDLNAACSGFVYGLQVADALIQSKMYQRILLVGSDYNSRYLDFSDRSTAILFGDGAGAVVLESSSSRGIVDTVLAGQDDLDKTISMVNTSANSSDHPYFEMKGSEVFRFAIKSFTKSVKGILKKHQLEVSDIDYVISHQANARIIESCAKSLRASMDKFPMNLDVYGNTSAASIPLVLDELNRAGKLKEGMKLVVVAFGGGLTYGASLIEW